VSEPVTSDPGSAIHGLPEDEVLAYVCAQRWFGGKARDPVGVRVLDHGVLRESRPLLVDALVDFRYGSGAHETYQLLAGFLPEGEELPGEPVASTDGLTAYPALDDPVFARELIGLAARGETLPTAEGTIEFRSLGGLPDTPSFPRGIRGLGLEQTNSSVVADEELIVKAYRRLEAGVNPELEMLRFLIAHGFENVPELAGWWSYAGPQMSATLGVMQRFVPGATEGWSLALEELASEPDAFLARTRRLGEVIGQMHAVLASDHDDPSFAPEEASGESLALLAATIDEEIEDVFLHLPDDESVAPIAGRGDDVRGLLREMTTIGSIGRQLRHHGDLHLGQVLWAEGDWLVIDFEGEPARPLPERRRKRSPLRDVAGRLRSFSYAVSVVGLEPGGEVETRARADFLEGYAEAVHGAGLLPAAETTERLIRIFELEKAVYELRYELAHRPDWVPVPVRAIQRLLEAPA
jgi:trehalose synthase-fused probable maltokinase